jgi:hypothetical protein
MRCGFCRVPEKEGRPVLRNSPYAIWRGEPYPRNLVLLDNDPFGVPRATWEQMFEEIRDGNFRISFMQGVNIRLINDDAARALASVKYYDHDTFTTRRLYTAWDNERDEVVFFRGIDRLLNAGVKARHIQVYMLIGWDPNETWQRIEYRHRRMTKIGLRPYPMPYQARPGVSGNNLTFRDLKRFQRWAIRPAKFGIPFAEYDTNARKRGWKPGERSSALWLLERSA